MPVVVSQNSTPEGHCAMVAAVAEAESRATRLVIVASCDDQGPQDLPTEISSRIDSSGIEHHVTPCHGDMAEEMLTTARENEAELIVIGLRRRSPVGKLLLGSGAQRILLDAPCPVLAVKAAAT